MIGGHAQIDLSPDKGNLRPEAECASFLVEFDKTSWDPGGRMSQTLDVSQFIDDRKVSWFNVQLVLLCFLAIFFDGYDLLAISYTAPAMIKELNLANQGQFTSVFTGGLVGILIGSLFFGYVGDRFGRKTAIVASCLSSDCSTWATVLCTTLNEIVAVRFLAGLGLGGLLPNIFSLTGELTPKRVAGNNDGYRQSWHRRWRSLFGADRSVAHAALRAGKFCSRSAAFCPCWSGAGFGCRSPSR